MTRRSEVERFLQAHVVALLSQSEVPSQLILGVRPTLLELLAPLGPVFLATLDLKV